MTKMKKDDKGDNYNLNKPMYQCTKWNPVYQMNSRLTNVPDFDEEIMKKIHNVL